MPVCIITVSSGKKAVGAIAHENVLSYRCQADLDMTE